MDFGTLCIVLLLLANLLGLPTARRLWRGQPTHMDVTPGEYGRVGQASWRGWRRAQPVIIVLSIPLLTVIVILIVTDREQDAIRQIATAIAVGVGALMAVTAAAIILFNRPRFLAPPRARSEAGLVRALMTRD